MTQYKIGQVLFVVLKKENRIVPLQIIEELVKRTLEGEIVTYMARLGVTPEPIAINDVDGEIYTSAEKLRSVLVERATSSLNKIIDHAVQKSREWYPGGFVSDPVTDQLTAVRKTRSTKVKISSASEHVTDVVPQSSHDEESFIELPDGTKARIRNVSLPKELDG